MPAATRGAHCPRPVCSTTCHRGAADVLIGVAARQVEPTSLDAWIADGRFTIALAVDRDPPVHQIVGTSSIVAPGQPEASELYVRMGLRDELQMPPLATKLPDPTARALVASWITAIDSCP